MCRTESKSLAAVESKDAAERIRAAEDRMIESMERMAAHAINRFRQKRGLSPSTQPRTFSASQRAEIRKQICRLADNTR